MYNTAVDNYPHALEFVPECYKTKKMFNKTIDIYHSTIKFVHKYLMTQSMCDETVNKFSFVSDSVPG